MPGSRSTANAVSAARRGRRRRRSPPRSYRPGTNSITSALAGAALAFTAEQNGAELDDPTRSPTSRGSITTARRRSRSGATRGTGSVRWPTVPAAIRARRMCGNRQIASASRSRAQTVSTPRAASGSTPRRPASTVGAAIAFAQTHRRGSARTAIHVAFTTMRRPTLSPGFICGFSAKPATRSSRASRFDSCSNQRNPVLLVHRRP